MVLVDTSVFISFLNRAKSNGVSSLESIIIENIPFGINNFIYLEILQGISSDNDFKKVKSYLKNLTFYELMDKQLSYENSSLIYRKCRNSGYTIRSTIDLLIAQTAIENNLLLLNNDKDYDYIAKV